MFDRSLSRKGRHFNKMAQYAEVVTPTPAGDPETSDPLNGGKQVCGVSWSSHGPGLPLVGSLR